MQGGDRDCTHVGGRAFFSQSPVSADGGFFIFHGMDAGDNCDDEQNNYDGLMTTITMMWTTKTTAVVMTTQLTMPMSMAMTKCG